MAKKRVRGNGEGTIWKEKRNGKIYYRAQVTVGTDENGEPIRESFSGYKKSEVSAKMNALINEINNGTYTEDNNIKLQDWIYSWLYNYQKPNIKASTFERYESLYRLYIKDTKLGKKKVISLKTLDFQRFINELRTQKSQSTVGKVKQLMSTSLNFAVEIGMINFNYCRGVKVKNDEKESTINALTYQDQVAVMEKLKGHRHELPIKLSFATGMRIGELLALKWSDIDTVNHTISIQRNIKKTYVFDDDGNKELKRLIQPPKTKSSIRTIPYPKELDQLFKDWSTEQKKIILYQGKIYKKQDYIFADEVGEPLNEKMLPRSFKKLLKDLKIEEVKYHDIRHTFATRLFEKGVPAKTVQVLLGHADISTTLNTYTHVLNETKEEAIDTISYMFK